jgi:hypothetical protein
LGETAFLVSSVPSAPYAPHPQRFAVPFPVPSAPARPGQPWPTRLGQGGCAYLEPSLHLPRRGVRRTYTGSPRGTTGPVALRDSCGTVLPLSGRSRADSVGEHLACASEISPEAQGQARCSTCPRRPGRLRGSRCRRSWSSGIPHGEPRLPLPRSRRPPALPRPPSRRGPGRPPGR